MNFTTEMELSEALNKMSNYAENENINLLSADLLMGFIFNTPTGKGLLSKFEINSDKLLDVLKEKSFKFLKQTHDGEKQVKSPEFEDITKTAKTLAQARIKNEDEAVELKTKDFIVAFLSLKLNHTLTQTYLNKVKLDEFEAKKYFSEEKQLETNIDENENSIEKKSDDNHRFLNHFGVELVAKAKNNKIDPVIGRDLEVEKTINILGKKRKANPLLVGDAGVGKTSIVDALALKIASGSVPDEIKNYKIYSLDMTSLVAGTKYRGDFEDRLKSIINEAKEDPNVVLFFDETHKLVGGGASAGSSMDAGNLLKPALSSGEIKVIGATTFKEYRELFQKDSGLDRRFDKVDVQAPTPENSLKILQGLQKSFEDSHKIKYSTEALKAAIDLSEKYIRDKNLPDKAIDLLDSAGSRMKFSKKVNKTVEFDDIAQIICEQKNIPIGSIKTSEKTKIKNLENAINNNVYGQKEAVNKLVETIQVSRAGLSPNSEKPIGSFLFAGPTGTGKTETAKQLAEQLGYKLIRFDMSEYMEKHAVSKLVGAPPGYVGFEQGGELTEKINQNPSCVILLDEIEKAHPDMYNILLQVFDYGKLTDGNGRTTDFKNAIIIMTTNLGASVISKKEIGFTNATKEEKNNDRLDAIKKHFSPEFFNRIDSVCQFNSLDKELSLKIVDKNLNILTKQLVSKNISAIFSDDVRNYLADKGFDPLMGARPLERIIKDKIISPLSKEVLFGNLVNGGDVIVSLKDEQIVFENSLLKNPSLLENDSVIEVKKRKRKI